MGYVKPLGGTQSRAELLFLSFTVKATGLYGTDCLSTREKKCKVGKGDALITGDAVSVINLLCIHVH